MTATEAKEATEGQEQDDLPSPSSHPSQEREARPDRRLLLRPRRVRQRAAPAPPAGPQVFLTVSETADLLRTTKAAVYSLIERRLIPGVVRLGRRVLVDRETLIRFVREGRAPSVERR